VIPSFKPAVHLTDLAPSCRSTRLTAMREAFVAFDKQIKGYYKEDAVLTGRRDPHLVADPHQAPRRRPAKPEHPRPVPGRRRRRLRRRHHVGGVDGIRVAEAVALSDGFPP
jgi:hypothetical protein